MAPKDNNQLPPPAGEPQQPLARPEQPAPQQPVSGRPVPQYGQPYVPGAFPDSSQDRPAAYQSPFRPAPPPPVYPYEPLLPNPGTNPYYDNPQLPEVMPDQPQAQQASRGQSGNTSKWRYIVLKILLTVVGLAVMAGAGVLAYMVLDRISGGEPAKKQSAQSQPAKPEGQKEDSKQAPAQEDKKEEQAEKPQVTELALDTFARADFVAPPEIPDGFKPFDYKVGGVTAYTTADRACELQFGKLGADRLPGNDALDVLRRQVDALRAKGNTVTDPEELVDLKLRNADDKNSLYNIKNYAFTASMKNGHHVRSHYAVAVLKDNTRAYILRICSGSGPIAPESLAAVESMAGNITLRPQN